jgi:sugar/nucleoside kinase (ribokinase family)
VQVVVTKGSNGCDIYTGSQHQYVPVARHVYGVHTTGAGDVFATSYAAYRSRGQDFVTAATKASANVVKMLHARK